MMAAQFDTLRAANVLRASGFDERQAAAIVETMQDSLTQQLATKADLVALESRMTLKLGGLIMAGLAVFAAIERFLI